jgi:hypothetical protein
LRLFRQAMACAVALALLNAGNRDAEAVMIH